MGLIKRHVQNKALLLRLAFVLGNLTTHSDLYREQVSTGNIADEANAAVSLHQSHNGCLMFAT
jgi:hypothetical protein